MSNSVYHINKGINKCVEFRGLKAQYIWWLGGGVIGLMVLFAIMYIIGLITYVCLGVIALAGTGWVLYVYKLSNSYGEFGMMKRQVRGKVSPVIVCRSRRIFLSHKKRTS